MQTLKLLQIAIDIFEKIEEGIQFSIHKALKVGGQTYNVKIMGNIKQDPESMESDEVTENVKEIQTETIKSVTFLTILKVLIGLIDNPEFKYVKVFDLGDILFTLTLESDLVN